MSRSLCALALCITALTLSACSSRDSLDQRLSDGCEAGVRHLLKDKDRQIDTVENAAFEPVGGIEGGRKVTLKTQVALSDYADYTEPETFSCIFEESFFIGYTLHNAKIRTVEIKGKKYGRNDKGVTMPIQEFMNLDDAVNVGMQ